MAELSEEYFYTAQRLTQQIEILLDCLRRAQEPRKQQALNSTLCQLRSMRRETMELAEMLLHYYEPGGRIYEEYRV